MIPAMNFLKYRKKPTIRNHIDMFYPISIKTIFPAIITVLIVLNPSSGLSLGYDVKKDFEFYEQRYGINKGLLEKKLLELGAIVKEKELKGKSIPCSGQIFLESVWLYNYTANLEEIEKHLEYLEISLSFRQSQDYANEQSEETGSWGQCYREWFMRTNDSVDYVEDIFDAGKRPAYALRFLDRINSPTSLLLYLNSLLVSDIMATGINNRKQLNDSSSALYKFWTGLIFIMQATSEPHFQNFNISLHCNSLSTNIRNHNSSHNNDQS